MSRHPSTEDLAAYSIGGLDQREERSVEKHLRGCEQCATHLREQLAPAVAVLAESVEQVEPPEKLRQSLMAAVRAEAEGTSAPRPRRSRIESFLLRPATGLAVVALAAAGVAGYLIAEDGGSDSADTVALTDAETGAEANLVVDDGTATLHMTGMEQLPMGDVYQVWVAGPTGVKPSAAFVPDSDGSATAAVPEAEGADQVMITREPMAGRQTPSGAPVFSAQL